jgi:hypothetical protein
MIDSGMAGVVVTETVLSHSDGARGILWVRGHTLPELAANCGYDGAVGLLWEGFAGSADPREDAIFTWSRARARLCAACRLAGTEPSSGRSLKGCGWHWLACLRIARPPRSSAPSRSRSPHCCAAVRATHHLLPNRRAPPQTICCA